MENILEMLYNLPLGNTREKDSPFVRTARIQCEQLELLTASTELRDQVHANTAYFREQLSKLGFDVLPGSHPIVAVMLYDAKVASEFAARMLEKGVYVVGFSYPVVPQGKARIRTQVSAGHTREDLDFAVKCFGEVKKEMGI